MTTLQYIAWALTILAFANTYFVWDSVRRYFRAERHPILLTLLVTKTFIWFVGLAIGILASRVALELPGLPQGGLVVAWGVLGIMLLPAFIWAVMRRFEA